MADKTGSAYGRNAPSYDKDLTEVGAGKPMGELLRRYWHPIALTENATQTPRRVRVLGEDLILFRDGQGRPGLVAERCAHRGSSLYYGKVGNDGIRCCYHGWLFDNQGQCLEQPCEPDPKKGCSRVKQPWYPVEERYGLVFAYMGPPDLKPVLPRYQPLEDLAEGEFIEANDASIGGGGPQIIPCNWLQHFENVVDPFHVPILHGSFSGTQFVELMGKMPEVQFDYTPLGVKATSTRRTEDGKIFLRKAEVAIPTLRVVPNPRVAGYGMVESIGWVMPIDDSHFRIFVAGRVTDKGQLSEIRSTLNGRLWETLSEEEHQAYPGDHEAQVSQGRITWHSEEHLAMSDRGIVMLRRFLKKQLEAVSHGENPVGVNFDEHAEPVRFEAGNFEPQ